MGRDDFHQRIAGIDDFTDGVELQALDDAAIGGVHDQAVDLALEALDDLALLAQLVFDLIERRLRFEIAHFRRHTLVFEGLLDGEHLARRGGRTTQALHFDGGARQLFLSADTVEDDQRLADGDGVAFVDQDLFDDTTVVVLDDARETGWIDFARGCCDFLDTGETHPGDEGQDRQ